MEFLLFEFIQVTVTSFLALLFWIMILPLLVQTMINGLISMVERVIRMNIRQFLNLIFFPGSLVRLGLLYLTLSLMGWEPSLSHHNVVGSNTAMSTGRSRRGFMISMRPKNKQSMGLREMIIIAAASQLAWLLVLLMVIYYDPIIITLSRLVGPSAPTWYFVAIISLIFGGMPIPEESMLPLEYLISHYPHWVGALSILGLASAVISGIYGPSIGQLWFLIISALMVARERITRKRLEDIDSSLFDADLIGEIMLL